MLQKSFKLLNFLFFFLIILAFPNPVHAQGVDWIAQGCAVEVGGEQVATIQGIKCVLLNLVNFIVPLIIIAAVIMVIYAGSQIIIHADDPKALAGAKQTLVFAIIGLIGIALSWVILVLIQQFTGAPVTEFQFLTNP